MPFLRKAAVVIGVMTLAAQAVHAKTYPDIEASGLTTTFDGSTLTSVNIPGTGLFSVAVDSKTADDDSIFGGTFDLSADFSSGNLTGGTIAISGGTLFDNSSMSLIAAPVSLTGTLTSATFSGDDVIIDFTTTGGNLSASGLDFFGPDGQINLNVINPAPAVSFTTPFTSTSGTADTYVVPLPEAGIAGMMLVGGLAVKRLRTQKA